MAPSRAQVTADYDAAYTDPSRRDAFIATYFPQPAGQPWLAEPVERFDEQATTSRPFVRHAGGEDWDAAAVAEIAGSEQYGAGHPWRDHLWVIKRSEHVINAILDPTYFFVDLQGRNYGPAIGFARVGERLYCTEGNHRSTLARFLGVPSVQAHVTRYVHDADLASAHAAMAAAGHEVTFQGGWSAASLGMPWAVRVRHASVPGLLHDRTHVLAFVERLGEIEVSRFRAFRATVSAAMAPQSGDWRERQLSELVQRAAWSKVRSG